MRKPPGLGVPPQIRRCVEGNVRSAQGAVIAARIQQSLGRARAKLVEAKRKLEGSISGRRTQITGRR